MNKVVTQAQFARIREVSKQRIAALVKKGTIKLTRDGKINVKKAQRALGNIPSAAREHDHPRKKNGAGANGQAHAPSPYMTHRTAREAAAAQDAQLELDRKLGRVALIEDVVDEVGKQHAAVRAKMLALPSERAPDLHRLKTVAEVEAKLREFITEALEDLSEDDVAGAAKPKH